MTEFLRRAWCGPHCMCDAKEPLKPGKKQTTTAKLLLDDDANTHKAWSLCPI